LTRANSRRAVLTGLHVLADDAPSWPRGPLEQAEAACAGGAAVVQLRAKHSTDAETLRIARAIRAATTRSGALFVINDRFDLALAAEADGVHLGQGDLPPAALPAHARERLLIGRSTHTPAQLAAAAQEPADYLAFGPVFGTQSKATQWSARGLAALAEAVAAAAPQPLVAIGGITQDNVAQVGELGAGAAVIGAVANAQDMAAATRALVEALAVAQQARS
jgi:thiamine-phosphate pyrophosphorylase